MVDFRLFMQSVAKNLHALVRVGDRLRFASVCASGRRCRFARLTRMVLRRGASFWFWCFAAMFKRDCHPKASP
jgi:hypothetical protein